MTKFRVTAIRTMRRVETYDVEAKDAATAKMTVESNHPFLDPTVVDEKCTQVEVQQVSVAGRLEIPGYSHACGYHN